MSTVTWLRNITLKQRYDFPNGSKSSEEEGETIDLATSWVLFFFVDYKKKKNQGFFFFFFLERNSLVK